MRRFGKPRWFLLFAVAALLSGCCEKGFEWRCCPTGDSIPPKPTPPEDTDGEGPPPEVEVPGGGGGEGAPPPSADAADAGCVEASWYRSGQPAGRGPRSNGTISRNMLSPLREGLVGIEKDGGATVALESFVLRLTQQGQLQTLMVKRYSAKAGARDRVEWKLNGTVLRPRESPAGDDIPEDLFGCIESLRGIRSETGEVVNLGKVSVR